jgi:hypothetical protein
VLLQRTRDAIEEKVKHMEENIEKVKRKTNIILYTLHWYLKHIELLMMPVWNKK